MIRHFLVLIIPLLLYAGTGVVGQLLKLGAHPPFNYVAEDWPVGRALPELALCARYSGSQPLRLDVTSGDPNAFFAPRTLNQTCWTLLLQKALDADKENADGSRGQEFSLALRVSDGNVLSFANLDIQVLDENDNAPAFVRTDTSIRVDEQTPVGTTLFSVSTTDPDTGVGNINNFRLEEDFGGLFEVREDGCEAGECKATVILRDLLNYDQRNVYTLEIIATDGAGRIERVNEAREKVTINILDSQNSPPRFLTDNRIQYVSEDTSLGSRVFRVEAVDGDAGVSAPNPISYAIKAGTGGGHFAVDASTGWLTLVKPLDRESSQLQESNGALSLTLVAKEEGPETGGSSELTLTVLVQDADDESPRCSQEVYSATVLENSPSLIPLTLENELYVYDNDMGSNGEFSVSLDPAAGQWLEVSPSVVFQEANLLIRVRDPSHLDYEERPHLHFDVILSPRGGSEQPVGRCRVELSVADANDNAPTFAQSRFQASVPENLPAGTFVIQLEAEDIDGDGSLVYELSGQNAEAFTVNGTGAVITAVPLDRERISVYQLTGVAVDEGGLGHRATVPLTLSVSDVNDEVPVFAQTRYTAFLPENSLSFTQLNDGLYVKATDRDEADSPNANITYFIEALSSGAANFTINPYTGQIVPTFPGVDREALGGDVLTLRIRAQDAGLPNPLSGFAQVDVYVNDTNDNAPVFEQSMYEAAVSENGSAGTLVLTVSATDADRSEYNRRLSYRIDRPVQDKFRIDAKTGHISVAEGAVLDRESSGKRRWELEVVAIDQGFPVLSGRTTVRINVLDTNNKPPVFSQKIYEVAVYETAPVFTSLLNLTARDPDEGAVLHYRIAGFMDAQTEDHRSVQVKAYNFSSLFGLHSLSGELYTARSLDRERMSRVTIVVEAEDVNATEPGSQVASALVDVTILDVNDNKPVYTQPTYIKRIPENLEMGSVILSVSAEDADSNATVLYQVSEEADGLVNINERTGELTVGGRLDYEEREWINFTVLASDTGTPPKTSAVPAALHLLDLNDNSPIFAQPAYNVSIRENSPPGTLLLRLNASDRDSGSYGTVTYFLLSEGVGSSFMIEQSTGVVRLAGPIDREARQRHTLTIQAVDDYTGHVNPDSHEATALVEVTVLDLNDNAPAFSANTPSSFHLAENDVSGHVVTTLQAEDPDDSKSGNGVIRYLIVDGNATTRDGSSLFNLEPQSGVLSLRSDLRGRFGTYELVVQARDLGTPFPLASNRSIPVYIADYNDHRPSIKVPRPMEEFPVPENSFSSGTVLVKIEADDADAGENAELRYSIKETTANEDWKRVRVDAVSGEVRLLGPLDREETGRLALSALACDGAEPPLCDEREFAITVIDKDDHCPVFPKAPRRTKVRISEGAKVGSEVSSFPLAEDADAEESNRVVCYDILSTQPPNAPFAIPEARKAEMRVVGELDREETAEYILLLRTSDCHHNTHCSSTPLPDVPVRKMEENERSLIEVRVVVEDANDNPPHFAQHTFRGGIQYDTKVGTRVTRVLAKDADTVDNGELRYGLDGPVISQLSAGTLPPSRHPFVLNSTSGDIRTNMVFLPEWKGNFVLNVRVNDSAGHSDKATVSISLLSPEEQVELLFRTSPNSIWDNAHHIIELLSSVTESTATIDDVRVAVEEEKTDTNTPDNTPDKTPGSKVLVHFVDADHHVLPVEKALRLLDNAVSESGERDKARLISDFGLRYAGGNGAREKAGTTLGMYLAFAGVSAALLALLALLVGLWCAQNHRYRRKLRAATTIAFASSADPLTLPAFDLPGTNLHSGANPVWGVESGLGSYGMDISERNSLDEAELGMKEPLSSASSGSGEGGTSSGDASRSFSSRARNGFPRTVPSYALASTGPPSAFSGPPSSFGGPPPSSFAAVPRKAPAPPPPPPSSTSPPPNYPHNIMAALESTEL